MARTNEAEKIFSPSRICYLPFLPKTICCVLARRGNFVNVASAGIGNFSSGCARASFRPLKPLATM